MVIPQICPVCHMAPTCLSDFRFSIFLRLLLLTKHLALLPSKPSLHQNKFGRVALASVVGLDGASTSRFDTAKFL